MDPLLARHAPPGAHSSARRHLHMIIARHRNGAFAAERDVGDLSRESTIADIVAGQVEDVERVIAFNPAEPWSRDATEDIAIEIAHRTARDPIQPALRDFIETNAGPDFARGLAVTKRAFSAA